VLADLSLSSTNLWFSSAPSRSSLHYDPYDNLLCVVTGSKRVTLHSPAAVLGLYAKPLGGEASNHSAVDFAAPDAQQHPLYRSVWLGGWVGCSAGLGGAVVLWCCGAQFARGASVQPADTCLRLRVVCAACTGMSRSKG
jgi:hypothetical protein